MFSVHERSWHSCNGRTVFFVSHVRIDNNFFMLTIFFYVDVLSRNNYLLHIHMAVLESLLFLKHIKLAKSKNIKTLFLLKNMHKIDCFTNNTADGYIFALNIWENVGELHPY